jgi:hypothetical protein
VKQTCSMNVSVLDRSVQTFDEGDTEWCEEQFSTNGQKIPMIRRDNWNGECLVHGQWTFSTDRSYQTIDGILVKTSCSCFLVHRNRRRFRHRSFSRFPSLVVHSTDQHLLRGSRYRVMIVSATNQSKLKRELPGCMTIQTPTPLHALAAICFPGPSVIKLYFSIVFFAQL